MRLRITRNLPSLSTLPRQRRLLAWVAVFSLLALVVGIALPLTRYLERTLDLPGLGRAASRLKNVLATCESYSSLLDTWGARQGLPAEIAAARAYVDDVCGPTGS